MVTLREVAAAAGVSPATASRALAQGGSGDGRVSTSARERVLRTARELGYTPDRAARTLATGRSGHLGLVVPDLENPFFAGIAKGVHARARELGCAVLLADADEDGAREYELVAGLQREVAGVVLCSPRMSPQRLAACTAAGTVVLVNRESPGVRSIALETSEGIRQALGHLRALGHRRVAYVGGPRDSWSDGARRAALRGPDDGGDAAGVTVVDLGPTRPVFGGGVAAADLALESGATAVLCYNDLVALGVLSRLRARGVSVPADMSVVGFDDIPAAGLVSPGLTTVSVPLTRLGREAVDLLLAPDCDAGATTDAGTDAGSGPGPDGGPVRRLPVELVVRESSAPARSASPQQRETA